MNIARFDRLPDSPEACVAFDHTGASDFFSTREWYEIFIDAVLCDAGNAQFLIASEDDGQVAAILPLWIRPTPWPSGKSRYTALANYYSCLYQPIVPPDENLAIRGVDALIEHLSANRTEWSMLTFSPMPQDAAATHSLVSGFSCRGFYVEQYPAFGNWYLPTTGMTFDAYFASRRKKMRNTVRSKTNQLASTYAMATTVICSTDGLEEALVAYDRIYATTWKKPEPYAEFVPMLARRLASAGKLRLGLLHIDGKPVAAQIWFIHNKTAHIYKLAYDAAYAKYSVGTILTMELVKHCLEKDGVTCIDFLSGDDSYKRQWMSHRRERITVDVINTRSLHGAALKTRRQLGALKRRLFPKPTAPENDE